MPTLRLLHLSLCLAVAVSACAQAGPPALPTVAAEIASGPAWLGLPAGLLQVAEPLPVGAPALQSEMAELHALRAALTAEQRAAVARWESGAVLAWNALARELVAQAGADPLTASRVYALLSVAQYDALQAAAHFQRQYARQLPGAADGGVTPLVQTRAPGSYPSEQAALAGASATVLQQFFPQATQRLQQARQEAGEARLWAGVNCRSDVAAGDALGQTLAAALVAKSETSLAQVSWDGFIPQGAGLWIQDPRAPKLPLRPEWGRLKPWLMSAPDEFRAPPPPAFGSAEYQAALAEVRQISDTRTPEQLRIAKFWADGAGTATPPGHWNQIAVDLLARQGASELEAARVLAYLNLALMDAGISAWDTKYAYWVIRPFNADPAISTPIGRPNHPSYTSGHASFSGAAAEFLGVVFPGARADLQAQATEAALSRVYGGIHYRFDGEAGLTAGRAIGQVAARRFLEALAAAP